MKYQVENGIYFLDEDAAKIERDIINLSIDQLGLVGFSYLTIPSVVKEETFDRQDIEQFGFQKRKSFSDCNLILAGSAEQGILEYFSDQEVSPKRVCSFNHCFREEESYDGLLRVREFRKVEQFVFCKPEDWDFEFELCLQNCEFICDHLKYKHRRTVMNEDLGYHKKKIDIEIHTKTYGWIEICSCSYFADEQTKRFGITGGVHTISCTGVASPRILIPILENQVK